ncbi:hypothetical protein F4782DRAFT_526837 [Xylaria castorea]|nr:hypothetical protein F4782DRAFT_526837 [Xylaria castorea]
MVKAWVSGSASITVDYSAAIYDGGAYPVSVADSITDTITKIADYVAARGASSRIVLLGLSQGGNVLTDELAGGVLKPDPIAEQCKRNIHDTTCVTGDSHTAHSAELPTYATQGVEFIVSLS